MAYVEYLFNRRKVATIISSSRQPRPAVTQQVVQCWPKVISAIVKIRISIWYGIGIKSANYQYFRIVWRYIQNCIVGLKPIIEIMIRKLMGNCHVSNKGLGLWYR